MALCRYVQYLPAGQGRYGWGWMRDKRVYALDDQEVVQCLTGPGPDGLMGLAAAATEDVAHNGLLAPLAAGQEVWAAGVTYESSKLARMAESHEGGDFYAKVYTADRPELFLKATPHRTVGTDAAVRIRADATWNVPEPELAVVIAANGQILGYTIGNDMSSRDIEGANPLYLPQAKVYCGSCALGPVVVPTGTLDPQNLTISLAIRRDGAAVFAGETSTARMRRTIQELVTWLFRENDFPQGVVLLTGTGLIPPDDFTLHAGDEIAITIEDIGTLRNIVESGMPR